MTTMVNPTWTQSDYRGRNDDGSQTTATWKTAGNNTAFSQVIDTIFRIRLRITETAGANQNNTPQFKLQFQKNGGGYADVAAQGATTDAVRYADSSLTDDIVTTQQIGTGSFEAGRIDENGAHTALGSMSSENTEMEWAVEIYSGQVVGGDTINLRAVLADGTLLNGGYTNTPEISVLAPITINATVGILALTGPQAIITNEASGVTINAAVGILTLSGPSASVVPGAITIAAAPGVLALSGPSASVIPGAVSIAAAVGNLTLNGPQATISVPGGAQTVNAAVGILTLNGPSASIVPGGVMISASAGSLSLSGPSASVIPGAIIILAAIGVLTVSGPRASITMDGEEYEGGVYVAPKFGKWWSNFRL